VVEVKLMQLDFLDHFERRRVIAISDVSPIYVIINAIVSRPIHVIINVIVRQTELIYCRCHVFTKQFSKSISSHRTHAHFPLFLSLSLSLSLCVCVCVCRCGKCVSILTYWSKICTVFVLVYITSTLLNSLENV